MFRNCAIQRVAICGGQAERFAAMYFTDKSNAAEFTKQQRERPTSEWEQVSQRIVAWLNKLVPMTHELKNELKLPRRMLDTVPIGLWEYRRRRWYKEGSAQKLNAILLQKRLHSVRVRNKSGHMSLLATPQYQESLEQIQTHRTRNTNYRSSVMQIRLGRLLSFLLQIGLIKTFDALERDMCLLFYVTCVKVMVESFQWDEAAKYVSWFIPDPECSKEASILLDSMLHLKKKFKAYIIFEESRASSWKELMSKTVETLKELVRRTPELKDRLDRVQMLCSTSEFEDIIPLGLRAYWRHNNLSSVGNMPAPVIAHFILQTRLRYNQ